jgi:membrane protein CcdC involved in cytochrome C biogenesis
MAQTECPDYQIKNHAKKVPMKTRDICLFIVAAFAVLLIIWQLFQNTVRDGKFNSGAWYLMLTCAILPWRLLMIYLILRREFESGLALRTFSWNVIAWIAAFVTYAAPSNTMPLEAHLSVALPGHHTKP